MSGDLSPSISFSKGRCRQRERVRTWTTNRQRSTGDETVFFVWWRSCKDLLIQDIPRAADEKERRWKELGLMVFGLEADRVLIYIMFRSSTSAIIIYSCHHPYFIVIHFTKNILGHHFFQMSLKQCVWISFWKARAVHQCQKLRETETIKYNMHPPAERLCLPGASDSSREQKGSGTANSKAPESTMADGLSTGKQNNVIQERLNN